MKRRAPPLPLMVTELALASGVAFAQRMGMVMRGTCSVAEYQRMVTEKMIASQRSFFALATSLSAEAVIAPWHRAATSNARRLGRHRLAR